MVAGYSPGIGGFLRMLDKAFADWDDTNRRLGCDGPANMTLARTPYMSDIVVVLSKETHGRKVDYFGSLHYHWCWNMGYMKLLIGSYQNN